MSGMTDPSRNDAPKKDGRDGGVQSASQRTNAGSRRMVVLAVCLIVVAMLIVCVAVVQAKAAVSRHRGYRAIGERSKSSSCRLNPHLRIPRRVQHSPIPRQAVHRMSPRPWRRLTGRALPAARIRM